ncbi:MAG: hypothetical protein R2813_03335 [Flavobacteriales bacterium]
MFVFRLPNAFVSGSCLGTLGPLKKGSQQPVLGGCFLRFLSYPLFEYFALARGYGMSFALLVLQIHFLLLFIEGQSFHGLVAAVIVTSLSVFAHLTLLKSAILVFGILVIVFAQHRIRDLKSIVILLILAVVIALNAKIGFGYSSIIKEYFPDDSGFFSTTVYSLFNAHRNSFHDSLSLILVFLPIIVGTLLTLVSVRKRGLFSPAPLTLLLLFGNVIACKLLSLIFEIHFPTERVALYFVPLFFIATAFSSSDNQPALSAQKFTPWLMCLLVIVVGRDFYTSWNSSRSAVEPYAHLPRALFEEAMVAYSSITPPIVVGDERLSYAWRYYTFEYGAVFNNYPLEEAEGSNYHLKVEPDSSGKNRLKKGTLSLNAFNMLEPIARDASKENYIGVYYKRGFSSVDTLPHCLSFHIAAKRPARFALYATLKTPDKTQIYSSRAMMDSLLAKSTANQLNSWLLPNCDSCTLSIYIDNIDRVPISITPAPR